MTDLNTAALRRYPVDTLLKIYGVFREDGLTADAKAVLDELQRRWADERADAAGQPDPEEYGGDPSGPAEPF